MGENRDGGLELRTDLGLVSGLFACLLLTACTVGIVQREDLTLVASATPRPISTPTEVPSPWPTQTSTPPPTATQTPTPLPAPTVVVTIPPAATEEGPIDPAPLLPGPPPPPGSITGRVRLEGRENALGVEIRLASGSRPAQTPDEQVARIEADVD